MFKKIIITIIIIIIIKVKAKSYMFQAIKINNYQNLLATENNRKVTFLIDQFQVSICSSTFSPCISPEKTFTNSTLTIHQYRFLHFSGHLFRQLVFV